VRGAFCGTTPLAYPTSASISARNPWPKVQLHADLPKLDDTKAHAGPPSYEGEQARNPERQEASAPANYARV